jgi:hypothetical protein
VRQRIETGWQRVRQSSDDYYLDGVALNLPSFYSGLERIFELVATRFRLNYSLLLNSWNSGHQ